MIKIKVIKNVCELKVKSAGLFDLTNMEVMKSDKLKRFDERDT